MILKNFNPARSGFRIESLRELYIFFRHSLLYIFDPFIVIIMSTIQIGVGDIPVDMINQYKC